MSPAAPSAPAAPRRLRAVRAILSVVVPPACAACRVPMPDGSGPLCGDCLAALPRLGPVCARCALPAHRRRGCPGTGAAFDSAWAPYAHDGAARAIVHAFKLGGRLPLAAWMASQMAAGLAAPPDAEIALVPVAASAVRRRRRGFEPAALLAAELGGRSGAPVENVLRRRDRARRQVGAGRSDRRAIGRIRVEAVAPAPIDVVLVDDVHTTGATLDACARALREAGAERVRAITFARTL